MEQSRARDVQRPPRAPFWCEKRSSQHDPGMLNFSARSQPPPSTENPGHAARMGHRGLPRAARVGARRGSVPRRCAPCTVPGRRAGGSSPESGRNDGSMPCRVRRAKRRRHRPGPRSGDRGASVQASPKVRACGHDAGRPSRAGAGDGRIDPPGCGSGCGSRSGYGRRQAPPFLWSAPAALAYARLTMLSPRTADRSRSVGP